MVPAISASTSSRREMLQAMTWASPPALLIPSATSLQASALRLEITTLAPSLASSSAEERPMPRLEPVTTATLPVRSNGVFFTKNSFRHSGMRRLADLIDSVIPGWSEGPDPESRDSGFDASHRPGMTGLDASPVMTSDDD